MLDGLKGDIERRKTICEILPDRFNRILYCASREKKVYFASVKFDSQAKRGQQSRVKSWVDPVQPSRSRSVLNIHGKKALLCIWWGQKKAVYYELLKPGETVTDDRYRQQFIKLNQALNQKQPE